MSLRQWTHTTTKAARQLVTSVIATQTTPLTTQQLYKLVIQREYQAPDKTMPNLTKHANRRSTKPPHPSNTIRSMSYMKNVVLADMLQRKEVEKVHSIRKLSQAEIDLRLKTMTKAARRSAEVASTTNTWVWKRRDPPAPRAEKEPHLLFGVEVGVGEDFSHLNKRRLRARVDSVARDMRWVRQLERARKEGLAKAEPVTATA